MIGLLMAWAVVGTEGIPIPYSPRMDDGITVVLLCCFFLSAYVLSRSRKFLLQLVKDFLLHRERTSIFATSTAADMRYLLLLILQTCILAGVCIFSYFNDIQPELVRHVSPGLLLGIYIGVCLFYLCLKWMLYSFLGWIFFDESVTTLWLESYSTLLYYLGFALFPFALFIVYFDLSLQLTIIIGLILAFFAKILMLYKWLKLFCNNLYGGLLLIVYFCALEIMPCLMLYQGVSTCVAAETGIREISLLRHRREVWCENRFSPIYQSGEPFSERVQTTENFGLGSYCRYFYFASCY